MRTKDRQGFERSDQLGKLPNSKRLTKTKLLNVYATILRNSSLWRVIPNGSSFGKTRLAETGRRNAKIARYKLRHSINVYISIEMYIFFVSDNYKQAVDEMLFRTSTTYAPWTIVESNSKKYARIKALRHTSTELEKAIERVSQNE